MANAYVRVDVYDATSDEAGEQEPVMKFEFRQRHDAELCDASDLAIYILNVLTDLRLGSTDEVPEGTVYLHPLTHLRPKGQ